MRRLVIHLGLPKTATTTLQTHVFPGWHGYLGVFHEGEIYPSIALAELLRLYALADLADGKQNLELDGRPVWVPAMQAWVKEISASNEDVLLWSEENLSRWNLPTGNAYSGPPLEAPWALPRGGSHPIVGFLQELRELLPQAIELKTILTLRNQSDWLISSAAQMGISNVDFIERLIRNDGAFLDYYALTMDLECLRGPENHLTLLFENGLENNIHDILQFVGYPAADSPKSEHSPPQENIRKSDAGWNVYQPAPWERLERRLRAFRSSSTFLDKHLESNQSLRRILRPFVGYNARKRALRSLPQVAKSITTSLTEEQRLSIKSHYETSNARLSAHLDADLKALGY